MYRVNNLLFVHTIFACILGVKLKNFPGGYAPLTPHPIFLGGTAPQTPCSVIWKNPFKIPGYATAGVPPLAVLCVGIEEFSERHKDSYRYEVLGGQHTAAAKNALLKENPTNPFYKHVYAEVYLGLDDKESLRLAARHNTNGHRMTHKDYVSL